MPITMITKVLEQIRKEVPSIELIVLTGGECFLLGDNLFEIVSRIKDFGFKSRIVTNASWATSLQKAFQIISRLKKIGLNEINVSTGDEHLKYVPIDNIVNSIAASVKDGIPITVNVESSDSKKFKSIDLISDERVKKYINQTDLVHIVNGQWMSMNSNAIDNENNGLKLLHDNIGRCSTLFMSPSLNYNGDLIGCCGLTSQNHPHLKFGNINDISINRMYKKSFDDILKLWIFTEGPYAILKLCREYDNTLPEVSNNLHKCKYCDIIFTDDRFFSIIRKIYRSKIPSLISKYIILFNRYK